MTRRAKGTGRAGQLRVMREKQASGSAAFPETSTTTNTEARMRKTYRLANVAPNPFRRIESYPIRRDKVEALKESIDSTGFWANIVARERDGTAEIAYGHHRLTALRELYGDDANHEVAFEVLDLDDARMIKIMARENMEEWGSSAAVEHETIRAVLDAYRAGLIELTVPDPKTAKDQIRHATGAHREHPYTAVTVARFVGWTDIDKVNYALGALDLIDEGVLSEADFQGLGTTAAKAVVVEARRAQKRRDSAADGRREKAEAAEAMAAEERDAEARAKLEEEAAAAREEERKIRQLGERQARHVGRQIAEDIRTGHTTARKARDRAREVDEIHDIEKSEQVVWADDAASDIAKEVGRLIDPDRPLSAKLNDLVRFGEHLSPFARENLAKALDQLSARAATHARAVRATAPVEQAGTTPRLQLMEG